MAAYEGIFECTKVSFTNKEHEKFLLPLMSRLVDEKKLLERATQKTVQYQVSIDSKSPVKWNDIDRI